MDGCHYMDSWGDIASNSCAPGTEEIKECTISHWFNNKEFCCPSTDSVCDPSAKPELQCRYETSLTAMACKDDEYEETQCTSTKMGGLYSHEFCCKRQNDVCAAMDGCHYMDSWGTSCPPQHENIKQCNIPHWWNEEEYCCPIADSVCNPALKPELACYYETSATAAVCPAGYYEEDQCTSKKVEVLGVSLYEHEFCCKQPEECQAKDNCKYQDAFNSQCPKGAEEVKSCSVDHWFSTKEFCCDIDDHKCAASTAPTLDCHYEQGALTTSCATGYEEIAECTEKKMCVLGVCAYEHEWCCIKPSDTCSMEDGCRYQESFGASCPAQTEEIRSCRVEGWFNDKVRA